MFTPVALNPGWAVVAVSQRKQAALGKTAVVLLCLGGEFDLSETVFCHDSI